MKGGNRVLVFLLCAGMELCYLYACTTFVTTLVFHRPWPFIESVVTFLLAAVLMLFSIGRGWRVISVIGVQSLGFIPALYRMVSILSTWSHAFLSQTWLTDFFDRPSDAIQYAVFVLLVAWGLVFWAGGAGLATRSRDYATLCARFDRGLVAFFVLFLVKFYLQVVQGIPVDEPTAGFLLVPFLIFSLLAIGLVRNEDSAQRDFIPGYQKIGAILGLPVVILLVGTGLVFFCLPYLTLAAEKGSDVLQVLSGPVLSVLFMVTNWLFGTDFSVPEQPAVQQNLPGPTAQPNLPAWLEPVGRILAVGVGILVGLVLLAIVVGVLYAILLKLFSKTAIHPERQSAREVFGSIFSRLRRWLLEWRNRTTHEVQRYGEGVRLYTALRKWGRYSGVAHFPSETPKEYGRRLEQRFPILAGEIELIVEGYSQEVYGETLLDATDLAATRSAWRRLASPSQWGLRFKGWLGKAQEPRSPARYDI